jgi:hypothetical protein
MQCNPTVSKLEISHCRKNSFCSTHPNVCDRTTKMEYNWWVVRVCDGCHLVPLHCGSVNDNSTLCQKKVLRHLFNCPRIHDKVFCFVFKDHVEDIFVYLTFMDKVSGQEIGLEQGTATFQKRASWSFFAEIVLFTRSLWSESGLGSILLIKGIKTSG